MIFNTERDGLIDVEEDKNLDGSVDTIETDPNDGDSDDDMIFDGKEYI